MSEQFDYRGFYNSVGEKYPEEDIVYKTPSGRLRKKFVSKLIDKYQKPPFLDIGCGGGEYLALADNPKYGVDLSHPSLLRCQKRVEDSILVEASAEEIRVFKDGYFNTVLCSEVIEHIEKPESLIEGVFCILKSGGIFIITCPNYRGERPIYAEVGVMKQYGVEGDKYLHTAYRASEIIEMAEKAGFSVVYSGTFEKEMRYWLRASGIITSLAFKILGEEKGEVFKTELQNLIFFFVKYSGIGFLLSKFAKEGIRTCVILTKN